MSEWYPESRSPLEKVAPHLCPPGRIPSCLLGSGVLLHGFQGTSAGRTAEGAQGQPLFHNQPGLVGLGRCLSSDS